ncbi:MAG: hypothetical protein ACRENK_07380 [Gemmatimonadaceae bacterium]
MADSVTIRPTTRKRRARVGAVICLSIALALTSPVAIAHAQTKWDRYKPGTLGAIMELHDSTIRAGWDESRTPGEHFSGDDFPTIATVIYNGDSRPLDPIRLQLLRRWGMAMMRDSSIAQDFHREYLFQEGQRQLWLPVQDVVASYFGKELKPGQPVRLFVMFLGAYYAGEEITWAFIVNEFTAGSIKR